MHLLRAGGAYRDQMNDGVAMQIARTVRAWCAVSLGLVLGFLTKTSDSLSRA